ncbi:MAG TPA: hypothetical protein VEU30_12665 [Thermoanaerobaculia bacterium]|nr:hypothetical protein [Thermoanaerobaculia bacterium]
MRKRSLALLIVFVLGTSTVAAASIRDRRDHSQFDRLVRAIKKVFGVSSTSDGLTPPRPDDPKP